MAEEPRNVGPARVRGQEDAPEPGPQIAEISKRLAEVETQRERALEALERSESRYRSLVEAAYDLICEIDEERRFVFVSPSFQRLLGLGPEDLIGTRVDDRIHPEDVVGAGSSYRYALAGRSAAPLLFRFRGADGSWTWLEGSTRRQLSADGRRSIVVICRDVSGRVTLERTRTQRTRGLEREVAASSNRLRRIQQDLQALERRVIQAERLDAAGELAGRIAHAISTPLSALIGTIQMKLEVAITPEPSDERVLSLARRIDRVVRGMLDLSRRGELELSELVAGSLLEELRISVAARASKRAIALEISVAANAPRIHADHALVLAAIEAVIENAVDASPRGGTVSLEARSAAGGRALEIRVADEGPGISSSVVDQIFDPFFTTKPKGTGLGLAIALGIVRGHGGRIRIDRVGGPGTRVCIALPAKVSASAESPSGEGI